MEYGQYVCEGEKIIHELITSQPESIDSIYACDSWKPPAQAKNLNIILASNKDLERMSQHATVPSVIALVNFPKSKNFKLIKQKFYLYLDHIADPGNLGTIIRTADWYGHKQIFLSPNCVDLYNQKVIQSAMGSHFRMLCFEIDFQQLIERHTFNHILATAMEGQVLTEMSDIRNSLIVLGSESHGVSEEVFKLCTRKMTIPSFGQTESLNVAVAAGIIIHHFTMND